MSTYYKGRRADQKKPDLILVDRAIGRASPDQILSQRAEQQCMLEGINYKALEPIQRLFLTHYRCPMCKLLPLYYLNLAHPKRVRCNRCGNLIPFTNAGKYGRLRKRIAFTLRSSGLMQASGDSIDALTHLPKEVDGSGGHLGLSE